VGVGVRCRRPSRGRSCCCSRTRSESGRVGLLVDARGAPRRPIALYESVLRDQQRILGAEDLDTLATLNAYQAGVPFAKICRFTGNFT
jgi:hypothetical protein